eukprot:sb/3467451/
MFSCIVFLVILVHPGAPSTYKIRAPNIVPAGGSRYEYEKVACLNGVVNQLSYNSGPDGNITWKFANFTAVTPFNGNFVECRSVFDLIQFVDNKFLPGEREPSDGMLKELYTFLEGHSTIGITCVIGGTDPDETNIKCTRTSACLTDECQCKYGGKPMFYCPGHLGGCIPFSQVCDGVANCEGGTDECMCSGAVTVRCLPDKSYTGCIPEKELCSRNLKRALSYLSCEGYSSVQCDKIKSVSETVRTILKMDQMEIFRAVNRLKATGVSTDPEAEACEKVRLPTTMAHATMAHRIYEP